MSQPCFRCLHEREIVLVQVGHIDVAQRYAIEVVCSDDHVVADLMTGGAHAGEVGEHLVVQLDVVGPPDKIGDGVVTVALGEREDVAA